MSSINSGTVYGHSDTSEERVADRQAQTDGPAPLVSQEADNQAHDEPKAAPNKPGFLARLGLPPMDLPTFLMMIKGAIPPTVGIAFYQSTAVADYFTTLGYLVGIMSVLSLSILPRGKFIQTLVLNLVFAGVGAATGLLIMWSSLQARLHTQTGPSIDPVTRRPTYNASQSAVSGLWLFVSIWFVNVLRAKYASLSVPVILYSIFTSISATYSPIMTSNAAFESIVKKLLTATVTAFALATVTSLLFIPVPSRKVTYGQMKGLIGLLRGAVKQEKIYLQSLERDDMFATPSDVSAVSVSPEAHTKQPNTKANPKPNGTAEAEALRKTITAMRELLGKMQSDLPFAKRDFAWGKLDGADLKELFYHLRACLVPIVGLSTVVDIFQRIAARRGWNTDGDTPLELLAEKTAEKRMWNEIMKHLHDPLESLSEALDQGIEHAAIVLELLPKPKEARKGETNGPDVEAKGGQLCPGDAGFADMLKQKFKSFGVVKGQILRTWAKEKNLVADDEAIGGATRRGTPELEQRHQHDQSQLFTLLYIEKLMQEIADSVQGLVAFADGKVTDGTMAKNRLIVPRYRRLKKWIASVFSEQDETGENHELLGANIVYMGDSFASKKDPEHLPPTNTWQRMGNGLRAASRFFSSEASVFGLRVACATMTIGIVNFLESTQQFFQEQRLVWAMIIIAIGMTQTSGQSIFGFFCRVGGTVIAMVLSLVNWYIVDEKVPGILVFLFIFLVLEMYFFLKFPQFLPAVMICMITHVMIIGYELQALKVGLRVTESNGQAFYPVYTLAPYRLATVAGGCLVAFIWTIFPSPLTERFWLRRDLASTLYVLANYFSVIDESLKMRLRGTGNDPTIKHCPAARLMKHRQRLFGKLSLLLPSLMQHAAFQKFEPTVGGVFPRDVYEDIIRRASRITSYLALMSHTVGYSPISSSQDRAWVDSMSRVMADVAPTKHGIICTLTLLSHSLQTGNSLPPHLPLPRPFELTRQLESMAARTGDKNVRSLLDAQHMADNGYAEFAVLQVCSALICGDLEELVRDVAKLVGVVDFSIHIENSSSSLDTAPGDLASPENESDERGKGKRD